MPDKSLVSAPCDTDTLCGISTSFPVLFPTERQVAHALLTRPPLNLKNASRRINSISSVRLECVMHAASVYPEPGSNSLKNGISKSHQGRLLTRYSPVRHYPEDEASFFFLPVRLECVMHAASVHPEPGSNS